MEGRTSIGIARAGRRPRASRLLSLLVFALLLALAAGAAGLAAGPAAAKDFSITGIDVQAQVMPNGDVRITDTRTLDFNGSFHFVYWDLSQSGADAIKIQGASGPAAGDPATTVPYEYSPYAIVGMSGGERQTYAVSESGGVVTVQLNFEVTDATASFTVRYVAKGAAKKFTDTAQLYWQFIGSDTAVESRDVAVTVHLPARA